MTVLRLSLVLLGLVLNGCSSGPVDNPVARSLTWFSYVAGDDIRDNCRPGSLQRLRFVYNAVWGEQVRSYDVTGFADGRGRLQSQVFGRFSASRFRLTDPFGPWRGERAETQLAPPDLAGIEAALQGSGFSAPPPNGRWLRSDEFYWAVSACQAGSFHFNAWNTDSPELLTLPFLQVLLPFDGTGVPIRQPQRLDLQAFEDDAFRAFESGADSAQRFRLQVGIDGLKTGL